MQGLGLQRRARPSTVDLPTSPRGIFGVASISHAPSKASRPHLTPPARRRRLRHPPHRSGPFLHRSSPGYVRAPLASTSGLIRLKIDKETTHRHSRSHRSARRHRRRGRRHRRRGPERLEPPHGSGASNGGGGRDRPASLRYTALRTPSRALQIVQPLRHRRGTRGGEPRLGCASPRMGCNACGQ